MPSDAGGLGLASADLPTDVLPYETEEEEEEEVVVVVVVVVDGAHEQLELLVVSVIVKALWYR